MLHCRTTRSFTWINLWAEFIKFLSFTVTVSVSLTLSLTTKELKITQVVPPTLTSKIDVRTLSRPKIIMTYIV